MKKNFVFVLSAALVLWPVVANAGNGPVLFADQDMPVGYCYANSDSPEYEDLCLYCRLFPPVDSIVDAAWCGTEVKFDTGVDTGADNPITITHKNGNPIPGKFPYMVPFELNGDGAPGILNFDGCPRYIEGYCVDAADACQSGSEGPIAVAIHADIYNYFVPDWTETAWAKECLQYGPDGIYGCQEWGTDFSGRNWATYIHVPCYTGEPGICGPGMLSCDDEEAFCDPIQDPVAEVCDDWMDNDCDGDVDCDDDDCAEDPACFSDSCEGFCGETPNEGDCWCDAACFFVGDCCEGVCDACADQLTENGSEGTCGDEVDSDCDGVVDCEDEDCTGDLLCIEPNSCDGVDICGGQSTGECWCDEACFTELDCCDDVCEFCGYLEGCAD